jgi:quercetin dioxygenase-like cupin family protein
MENRGIAVMIEEMVACDALGACSTFESRALSNHIAKAEVPIELVREMREVAALIGLVNPDAVPPVGVRDKLLAQLEPKSAKSFDHVRGGDDDVFTIRANEGAWEQIGRGISMKRLFAHHGRGTQSFLLQLAPKSKLPAHRHPSVEELIILSGDCQINGEILNPGDYRCALSGSSDYLLTTETGTTVLIVGPIDYDAVVD